MPIIPLIVVNLLLVVLPDIILLHLLLLLHQLLLLWIHSRHLKFYDR
jgi:hypothetical protein